MVGVNQSVLQVRWREPPPASLNGPFKSFRIHYHRVRRVLHTPFRSLLFSFLLASFDSVTLIGVDGRGALITKISFFLSLC